MRSAAEYCSTNADDTSCEELVLRYDRFAQKAEKLERNVTTRAFVAAHRAGSHVGEIGDVAAVRAINVVAVVVAVAEFVLRDGENEAGKSETLDLEALASDWPEEMLSV